MHDTKIKDSTTQHNSKTRILPNPPESPIENYPTFSHTVLICAATSTEIGQERPAAHCALHHWDHASLGHSTLILTGLSLDNLSYIKGFRELGHFSVSQTLSSPEAIHGFLSSLIKEAGVKSLCEEGSETGPTATQRVITKLQELAEGANTGSNSSGTDILLFSINVTGSLPDTLIGDEDSVWRWEKPDSPYAELWKSRKGWSHNMDSAVNRGVQMAGKGFSLEVRGLDRRQKDYMFSKDGAMSLAIPPKDFRE